MALVTDHLRQIIQNQVKDHGLVVWYDPERHYVDVAPQLDLPDTHFLTYEDSFYRLRHQIEPYFAGIEAPRLVIYVPLDPAATDHALIEIEAAGVVLKPGQTPVTRNTRLSVIARAALKSVVHADEVESIVKRVDAGTYSLADLDKLAGNGSGLTSDALKLVFSGRPAEEIALMFVTSEQYDTDLAQKDALGELSQFLIVGYGLNLPAPPADAPALRAAFVRHLLRTDLYLNIQGAPPPELDAASLPHDGLARDACTTLAYTWRQRTDLRQSYVDCARTVEVELPLMKMTLSVSAVRRVETFLAVEVILQRGVIEELLRQPSDDAVALAEVRLGGFWSQEADVQPLWSLIATAGRLILEAKRIEKALKDGQHDAAAFIAAYTHDEFPYCLLDTYHRQMELSYHRFEFDPDNGTHDLLERLVVKARDQYMQVGSTMAARFLSAYHAAGFAPAKVLRQTQIFDRKVRPALDSGRVAYVWVDALRYEMARDLVKGLQDDFSVRLEPALATPPTITPVGMAALLPGADTSRMVLHKGALTLQIGDVPLKERADRVKFLQARYAEMIDVKLADLVPRPKKVLEANLRKAAFALVTSQEIDESGEKDSEAARLQMDNVLLQLQQGLRTLARFGFETIILTADHGHLFVESLGDDMKIEAPGGETVALHRRAWVGRGGNQNDSFLRAPLSAFGLEADYELAVPYTFGVFLVQGGASRYFHGGLSPQEAIIPVLTLSAAAKGKEQAIGTIQWTITPGSQKLGRYVSVKVNGAATSLFMAAPLVRLELRHGNQTISSTVSADRGYDSSTENLQLETSKDNPTELESVTATLLITADLPPGTKADLLLLDPISGTILEKLEGLELAIHM